MTDSLQDCTVLITGAYGGIGAAMVEAFGASGARLALVDIARSEEIEKTIKGEFEFFECDLSNPEMIAAQTKAIGDKMGIDVLINNAGFGFVFPASDTSHIDEWNKTIDINLRAPWLMAAGALPYLKKSGRGRIINISSQAGVVAIEEHAAYGASKAGLNNLTKILAIEWAKYGITANAIAPTVVETPMAQVGWAGEKGEKARRDIPVGRFAQPFEIAALAKYLASEAAGIVNGSIILADGGYSAK